RPPWRAGPFRRSPRMRRPSSVPGSLPDREPDRTACCVRRAPSDARRPSVFCFGAGEAELVGVPEREPDVGEVQQRIDDFRRAIAVLIVDTLPGAVRPAVDRRLQDLLLVFSVTLAVGQDPEVDNGLVLLRLAVVLGHLDGDRPTNLLILHKLEHALVLLSGVK